MKYLLGDPLPNNAKLPRIDSGIYLESIPQTEKKLYTTKRRRLRQKAKIVRLVKTNHICALLIVSNITILELVWILKASVVFQMLRLRVTHFNTFFPKILSARALVASTDFNSVLRRQAHVICVKMWF